MSKAFDCKPLDGVGLPDRPFHNFEASKFPNYIKFANLLMLRLLNCERVGRVSKIEFCIHQASVLPALLRLRKHPDRTFPNYRASKSGDRKGANCRSTDLKLLN